MAAVLTDPLLVAGFGHNHRHGAEAMAEDRAKDGLNHLDFRVYRAIPATGDGRQDECRDRHIPSRQCLGITDKRIIRRIVLAMGFLRG